MTEDATAAIQYSGCQQKHAEVVGLYELWRRKVLDFVAKLRSEEK